MKKIIVIILIAFLNNACVNNVDFDQDTTVDIVAPYTLSFVYMKAKKADFRNSSGVTPYSKELNFNIDNELKDKVFSNITFNFTVENSFLNEFELKYEFFDASNNLLDEQVFTISAHSAATGSTETSNDFILTLNNFRQTESVIITVTPLNTQNFPPDDKYEFNLNSSMSFEINYG